MSNLTRGIAYGVSGTAYFKETLVSAKSVKQCMPQIPLYLALDKKTFTEITKMHDLSDYFDIVKVFESSAHWRTQKFFAMLDVPFDEVIFLDGDTYVGDSIEELYDLLKRFEIAAMPAPQRIHPDAAKVGLWDLFKPVPNSFTEYNTGVVVYRNNTRVKSFLEYWMKLFEKGLKETGYSMDQATMRVALFYSDMQMMALMPEYNFRGTVPNVVRSKVKIVHAHGDLPELLRRVNQQIGILRTVPVQKDIVRGFRPEGVGEKDGWLK